MGYYPHPVEIEYRSDDDILYMVFSDDHVSEFPTPYLRGYCPCARCQGHSGSEPKWQELRLHRQVEVVDVDQVGGYALSITWADGHDTGIYSFQKLREMCPCSECMPDGLPPQERSFEAAADYDGADDETSS